MSGLVYGEDHLPIHVLKVRPEGIQRQIVFIVLLYHFVYLGEGLVTPSALVVTKTPKGRDVPSSNVLMVSLKKGLRVEIAQNDDEVNMSPN